MGLRHVSRARGCLPSADDLVKIPDVQTLLCGRGQGLRDRGLGRRTSAERIQVPPASPNLSQSVPTPFLPPVPGIQVPWPLFFQTQDSGTLLLQSEGSPRPQSPFLLSRCLDPQASPSDTGVWAPSLLLARNLGSSHLHIGRGKGHRRDNVVGDTTAGEMPVGPGSRYLGPRDWGPWGTIAQS